MYMTCNVPTVTPPLFLYLTLPYLTPPLAIRLATGASTQLDVHSTRRFLRILDFAELSTVAIALHRSSG